MWGCVGSPVFSIVSPTTSRFNEREAAPAVSRPGLPVVDKRDRGGGLVLEDRLDTHADPPAPCRFSTPSPRSRRPARPPSGPPARAPALARPARRDSGGHGGG